MPIPVATLPWHIQKQIAEKTDLSDFVAFQQVSKQSSATANRVNSRFTLPFGHASEVSFGMYYEDIQCRIRFDRKTILFKLSEVPQIRFDVEDAYFDNPLNEELWDRVICFFVCSGSTTSTLRIWHTDRSVIDRSPDSLRDLLNSARVKELYIHNGQITPETFRKIPEFVKQIICKAPLSDDDLLSTKAEVIRIGETRISNKGINSFLKEWKEDKRKFQTLVVSSVEKFGMPEILGDFDYSMTQDIWNLKYYSIERGSEVVEIELAECREGPVLYIDVKENKNKK